MPLPAETRSHHTIWIDVPGGRTVAVRYAADGDRLVCLGDGLAGVTSGTHLSAALRGLASGPQICSFRVRVVDLAPDGVSPGLLAELVGHRALGRTADEVNHNLETIRTTRRLLALEG